MSKPAFTLIEILLSLFILAVSMSVLSNLQVKSIMRTSKGREEIDRIFISKERMYTIFANPPAPEKEPVKEKLDEPAYKLTMYSSLPDKKSTLYPFFKNKIMLLHVDGRWSGTSSERTLNLISMAHAEPAGKSS